MASPTSLLDNTWQRLGELGADADRAIHGAWVRHRNALALLLVPAAGNPQLQRKRFDVGKERFERCVAEVMVRFWKGVWCLYHDISRDHGDVRAREVWETLQVRDYLPANYRKTRVGNTPGPQEVLSALERVTVEEGDVEVEGVGNGGNGGNGDGWDGESEVEQDLITWLLAGDDDAEELPVAA
ncbi:hypothetical protein B0I37DRAFT_407740 [Chaetomium sp. MPI-CAGE-AT-0009]|nr:hypothetical protein B0I37DRAFT_407740 [Chaetomium sp. MPI-CAGE-AT-0009]